MRYLNITKDMVKSYQSQIVLLIAVLFIAACSNKQQKPSTGDILPIDELSTVVYFDYDSSEIKEESYSLLDDNVDYIIQQIDGDPAFSVIVEGHCDERGTIEYNFALGNRRAEAIARYLRVKGVPSDNLRIESYGEQRPVDFGSGESAWSQNRRGELVYPE